MQTQLADFIKHSQQGARAEAILRSCVHCGFCTATCPTYQLLGDELDGPRGRIYLIKQVLEGGQVSRTTQQHLDRCLSCQSCETTCPSGVRYAQLLDIGREVVEKRVKRPWLERLMRFSLRFVVPFPKRFGYLLAIGRALRFALPSPLKSKVPPRRPAGSWPTARHSRRMLVLDGCVQPAIAPSINAATARVLDKLGISLIQDPKAGCCGAVSHHLNANQEALRFVRSNIETWNRALDNGVETLVMTASGCGAMVRQYGQLLAEDPQYARLASRISQATRDLVEVLHELDLSPLGKPLRGQKIAVHTPCTLQHAQRLPHSIETLLQRLGADIVQVDESHLCCGSAGTYSILQPKLSNQLKSRKLAALSRQNPMVVATANIGCMYHLQSGTKLPIRHWVELLA